jgi:hypothetical protein
LGQPFALEQLKVASPCHANWDDMRGSEQVRFCDGCQKNVYNLSGMTRPQAESLVAESEGKLCIRFYRRNDGKLLTADCPVGWRAKMGRRMRRTVAAVMAGLGGLASAVGCGDSSPFKYWMPNAGVPTQGTPAPIQGKAMMGAMCPPVQAVTGEAEMGDMVQPAQPPTQPPTQPPAPILPPAQDAAKQQDLQTQNEAVEEPQGLKELQGIDE